MTGAVPLQAAAAAAATSMCDVQALAFDVGLPEAERRKLRDGGLRAVPIAKSDLASLIREVVERLAQTDCRAVVFAHSLELDDTVCGHLVDLLKDAIPSLEQAPLLLSGRPCSVIHLGVELAARLWRRKPDGTVLLLGGDVAENHDARFFFGSAMGDAVVGMMFGGVSVLGDILATSSSWHVVAADGAASSADDIARFRAENPTAIRQTITDALAKADLTWSDLSAIVPHTPYRTIWDMIAQLCQFPRDRILDQGISETGHLNSNDVVVHMIAAIDDGRLSSGDVAALVSQGFGGARGCTLVRVS
ncbi:3-oxoacyl-[acyl-carrier-protein] synthase III C-terminal domain-containing protein [Nocardia sp. NPDC050175]|uniref:3-oxoacyl-[acyl-carrier-protein] synthase III C-terminal domain-containing protein n=1 Tax=Nocardia sp. NPDC050175 TaxID=3364317 RepID=UPI0037AF4C32